MAERHPNEYKYNKERYARKRLAALVLLGGKCAVCGFADSRALEIDHIHGNGYIDRKRNPYSVFHRILTMEVPEETYQILCANCHRIKTFEKGEFKWRNLE